MNPTTPHATWKRRRAKRPFLPSADLRAVSRSSAWNLADPQQPMPLGQTHFTTPHPLPLRRSNNLVHRPPAPPHLIPVTASTIPAP
jgi:hypothetical protein